jgi:hypothetical protein
MSEDALWRKARDELGPWGMLVRIEPAFVGGCGDVSYALRAGVGPECPAGSGWIELKHVPAWPVRESTPVVIEKLKREQVQFGLDWTAAGGRSWFLVQVARGYWLLDPPTAHAVYKRELTGAAFRSRATVGNPRRFPRGDVLRALCAE